MIDGKGVLRLEHASGKRSTAAWPWQANGKLLRNQRNARKSTGPRSRAGRKRASGNAYRHGLSLSITSSPAFAKQLDKLARKIAGDTEDVIILERARAAAEALLDLARVRRADGARRGNNAPGRGPKRGGSVRRRTARLRSISRWNKSKRARVLPSAVFPDWSRYAKPTAAPPLCGGAQ